MLIIKSSLYFTSLHCTSRLFLCCGHSLDSRHFTFYLMFYIKTVKVIKRDMSHSEILGAWNMILFPGWRTMIHWSVFLSQCCNWLSKIIVNIKKLNPLILEGVFSLFMWRLFIVKMRLRLQIDQLSNMMFPVQWDIALAIRLWVEHWLDHWSGAIEAHRI